MSRKRMRCSTYQDPIAGIAAVITITTGKWIHGAREDTLEKRAWGGRGEAESREERVRTEKQQGVDTSEWQRLVAEQGGLLCMVNVSHQPPG